jgi:ABC-2 family transporter protein
MMDSLFLTRFFVLKKLTSGSALLLALLSLLLVLSGFLSSVTQIEQYARTYGEEFGGQPFSILVQTIDKGSVHEQVWEATNFAYLHSYPIIGGALLPLRFAAPWLFIILPFVGLLLGACEVSGELETGVAQTLYGAPVKRSMLGMSRILGDSLAIATVISISILVALAIGSQLVDYEITRAHLARSTVFVLILGFYTSIFVQAGTLISALSRRSARSLWV